MNTTVKKSPKALILINETTNQNRHSYSTVVKTNISQSLYHYNENQIEENISNDLFQLYKSMLKQVIKMDTS